MQRRGILRKLYYYSLSYSTHWWVFRSISNNKHEKDSRKRFHKKLIKGLSVPIFVRRFGNWIYFPLYYISFIYRRNDNEADIAVLSFAAITFLITITVIIDKECGVLKNTIIICTSGDFLTYKCEWVSKSFYILCDCLKSQMHILIL